jgi:hypothetical protein
MLHKDFEKKLLKLCKMPKNRRPRSWARGARNKKEGDFSPPWSVPKADVLFCPPLTKVVDEFGSLIGVGFHNRNLDLVIAIKVSAHVLFFVGRIKFVQVVVLYHKLNGFNRGEFVKAERTARSELESFGRVNVFPTIATSTRHFTFKSQHFVYLISFSYILIIPQTSQFVKRFVETFLYFFNIALLNGIIKG